MNQFRPRSLTRAWPGPKDLVSYWLWLAAGLVLSWSSDSSAQTGTFLTVSTPGLVVDALAKGQEDPIPLRRILLPLDKWQQAWTRVGQGTLLRLSRASFEDRLRHARAAMAVRSAEPRLMRTSYRARLHDGGLSGQAYWTFNHPSHLPGFVPIEPFNLALRNIQSSSQKMLFGITDGTRLGILSRQAGEQVVGFEWSLRGDASPGSLRFRMEIPSCALTTVELELPRDRLLRLPAAQGLLSSAQPAADGLNSLWRIDCANQSELDIEIVAAEPAGRTPLVLSRLVGHTRLFPGRQENDLQLNLEILNVGVRELVCDFYGAVQPVDVQAREIELESWELLRPSSPELPGQLKIRLGKTAVTGELTLNVRALGSVPTGQLWTCPLLVVHGGIARGEQHTLTVAGELRLEDWQQGTFQLSKANQEPGGVQELTLQSLVNRRASEALRHRPRAVVRQHKPELHVVQALWWQIRPGGSMLTSQLSYRAVHGSIQVLVINCPPGFRAEKVDVQSPHTLRTWKEVSLAPDQVAVWIELLRPLPQSGEAVVVLALRTEHGERVLPLPRLDAVGTSLGESLLGISLDPKRPAIVRTSGDSVEVAPTSDTGTGNFGTEIAGSPLPWGGRRLDHLVRFGAEGLVGAVDLHQYSPRMHTRVVHEVTVDAGGVALEIQILVVPENGALEFLDIGISGPTDGQWSWKVLGSQNRVRDCRPLPTQAVEPCLAVLAAPFPMAAAAIIRSLPSQHATTWRLTLEQPIREATSFQAKLALQPRHRLHVAEQAHPGQAIPLVGKDLHSRPGLDKADSAKPQAQYWQVPLITSAARAPISSEVRLRQSPDAQVEVGYLGLQETTPDLPQNGSASRTFQVPGRDSLLLLRQPESRPEIAPLPNIDMAHLHTTVHPTGQASSRYSFRLRSWKSNALPVRLPPGSSLLAVAVDNRLVSHLAMESDPGEGMILQAPVPKGEVHLFDITYATSVALPAFLAELQVPAPTPPLTPITTRRTWTLPNNLEPIRGVDRIDRPLADNRSRPSRSLILQDPATADVLDELGFQTWESSGQGTEVYRLAVVRSDSVMASAGLLALLVLFVCLPRGTWKTGTRLTGVILGLAALGLTAVWLPDALRPLGLWPFCIAVTMGAVHFYGLAQSHTVVATKPFVAGASLLVALAIPITLPGQAVSPESQIVGLIPAADGDFEYLVAPELLQRIDDLSRPQLPGLRRSQLLSAEYVGSDRGDSIEFIASYEVHVMDRNEQRLVLPLGNVQLLEVRVDRVVVLPRALPAGQTGYEIPISGLGRHRLQVRFMARVTATPAHARVLFRIPATPRSRLEIALSGNVSSIQALGCEGTQRSIGWQGMSRFYADLGRSNAVHIRLQRRSGRPSQVPVQANEIYLWDLKAARERLLAILEYTIPPGSVSEFKIDLPDGLEPAHVRTLSGANQSGPVRLRDWDVGQGQKSRFLRLRFQPPLAGTVQVFLELIPSGPISQRLALSIPHPQDVSFVDSLVGYRVEDQSASVEKYFGVTGIQPEEFALRWQTAGVEEDPGPPERAYRIQRSPNTLPTLELAIRANRLDLECDHDVRWRVDERRAAVKASLRVVAVHGNVLIFQVRVSQQLQITSVRGANVRSWSRRGEILQVWLRHPLKVSVLAIEGSTAPVAAAGHTVLSLPLISAGNVLRQSTRMLIQAGDSVTLLEESRKDLVPMPSSDLPTGELRYWTDSSSYAGRFQVRPSKATIRSRVLQVVSLEDGFWVLRLIQTCDADGFLPRELRFVLRNWPEKTIRIEDQGKNRITVKETDGQGPASELTLEPGSMARAAVMLTSRIPVREGMDLLLPSIRCSSAAHAECQVLLAQPGLSIAGATGQVRPQDWATAGLHWTDFRSRLPNAEVSCWQIVPADAPVYVRRVSQPGRSRPLEMYVEEYRARQGVERRWLYSATFVVFDRIGFGLDIQLPPDSECVQLSLDGQELPHGKPGRNRLWLSTAGQPGKHRIELSWVYMDDGEVGTRPRLQHPLVSGAVSTNQEFGMAKLWEIRTAPGHFCEGIENKTASTSEPHLLTARAAGLLHLLKRLVDENSAAEYSTQQLTSVQYEFLEACQAAERSATNSHWPRVPIADMAAIRARLTQLRLDHSSLLNMPRLEAIREAAQQVARRQTIQRELTPDGILLSSAATTYWLVTEGGADGVALELHEQGENWPYSRIFVSLLIVASLAGCWAVSFSGRAVNLLRMLWPETLIVLGLVSTMTVSSLELTVALLLVGGVARFVLLARKPGSWRKKQAGRPEDITRAAGLAS